MVNKDMIHNKVIKEKYQFLKTLKRESKYLIVCSSNELLLLSDMLYILS
jgi:hypothetical protein